MLRPVVGLTLVGLIVALPVAHDVIAKADGNEKVDICHVNSANSPAILENYQQLDYSFDPDWPSEVNKFPDYWQLMTWTWHVGRVISVDESAVESHVGHGDSTDWYAITDSMAAYLTRTIPTIDQPVSGQAYIHYGGSFYRYWWTGWFHREWTPAVLKNANCYWVTIDRVREETPN